MSGFSTVIPKKRLLIEKQDNNVRQRVSTDLSRLEIRDSDEANLDEIAARLFCVYSPCGQNNLKSLQQQIHYNVINHRGLTPTL